MKIKRISESLNERYKEATNFKVNDYGWKVAERNFVDDVFDHIIYIVEQVNYISEKDFKTYDNIKKYMEMYFDNNPEILLEIDIFKNEEKRKELAAEILYDKYFKNKIKLNEC